MAEVRFGSVEDGQHTRCCQILEMASHRIQAEDADEEGEDGGELDLVLEHLLVGLGNAINDALRLDGLRDEERGERRVGRLLVAWRTPLPLSRLARATLLLALVLALLLVGCIRIALWCSSLG